MFKDELALVPHLPGSYQMYDKFGVVIYVGKAKDLRARLSSYFTGRVTGKTKKMVSEVDHFEYIVTNSELESFILEINLIKKYDPKYNILLRDDKSYPYIEYTNNPYPALKVVRYRTIKKHQNRNLFGPYVHAYAARRIVNLLNRLYPLKKCENTPKHVCLYYHIGECLGYCEKNINKERIAEMESEILSFLRGNDEILKTKILKQIDAYSNKLNFEAAKELRDELNYINIILEKQKVELQDRINRDIINYYFDNGYVSLEIFFIRNGKLVGHKNHIAPVTDNVLEELEIYIALFYSKHEVPKEIIINKDFNTEVLSGIIETKFSNVTKGPKKKLLDMAYSNAKINLENKLTTLKREEERTEMSNEELGKLLNIKINRIDVFDNSNIFGTFSVSGMVVFKNGLPAKKEYRKYKIVSDAKDDYHMMKEVIYRRYFRSLMEKTEFPELILVDGGKSQVNACLDTLKELNLHIKVCGLVKNDKHRTNDLLDGDTMEIIKLDKTSNVFHFLTRMQDEVHRYTINYHREIRSKGSIQSVLDNVPGIGDKRRKELIKKFGSVKKISEATIEELMSVVPEKTAQDLFEYLKNYNKKGERND